jgi:Ni,Fe-hydrogenase I large subunit
VLVGPFNRVEGDLEVALDVAHGRVTAAWVNATMYRGFEQMLRGQPPADALVWVPRICGICSVSQSVAAARALADMAGVTPPPNGERVTQVMLATENLADHLTHFYVFFMADFCRPCYASQPWYAEAVRRWQPTQGEQLRLALAARQRWFTIMGTLDGKWPHTQAIAPGGSSRAVDAAEQWRLLAKVREFRSFLEQQLFAAPLEEVASLDSEAALWRWCDAAPFKGDAVARHGGSVFTRVLARLWELALEILKIEQYLLEIKAQEAFCVPTVVPTHGQGQGHAEAARGSLGHWLVVAHERIHNDQIIAPTSWNFSPRDAQGTPGALEQALVGLPMADDGAASVAVQHVVRSFDPCMVCTVH